MYILKKLLLPSAPSYLAVNFKKLDTDKTNELKKHISEKYFQSDRDYLSSPEGREDFEDHLFRRLNNFRENIITWLDSSVKLKGAKILEIGCGTGSSTVALAEQGADVIGVDIVGKDLVVAENRCKIYDVQAQFVNANAVDVHKIFKNTDFDLIVFFAALEHMTMQERITAISSTYKMLKKNKFWCITGSPNRLWYFDDHTSCLPFFHWLPDDLAFKYSKFSPRKTISGQYREANDSSMLHFLRRGRGISYHEFEIAIGNVNSLEIVNSLALFNRGRSLIRRILWRFKPQGKYERFLINVGNNVHRGFYQPYLDLIIKKTTD